MRISISDDEYTARRREIAECVAGHVPGEEPSEITYTDAEHELWGRVVGALTVRHAETAAGVFLDAAESLRLPADRVPQLREVDERLRHLTDFGVEPAPGLVPFPEFCATFSTSRLQSTRYLRHHSTPFYTDEPDLLHEMIGHATILADDRFARLYRMAGEAVERVETAESVDFLAKFFWFTMECGLLEQDGRPKAFGATLVSSTGELDHLPDVEVRPLDVLDVARAEYDITDYQPVLFSVRSVDELEDVAGGLWSTFDDDLSSGIVRAACDG